jgi:adhesin transport system outer membrane protein
MQEAAQAGVAGARWQFFPTPSLSFEKVDAASSDPSYRGDQQVSTVGVRQPLWTGGRLTGNLAKAEAQELASRAELEGTRQQLALRVLQAYADAIASQAKYRSEEHAQPINGCSTWSYRASARAPLLRSTFSSRALVLRA